MSAPDVKLTKISLPRVRSHTFCHSPPFPASSEKLVLHRTLRQIRSIGFHKESWSLLRTKSTAGAPERAIVINMLHTFQLFQNLLAAWKDPESSSKAAAKQQQSSSKAAAKQQSSKAAAAKQQQQQSSKAAKQQSSKAAKQQSSKAAAAATAAQKHYTTGNPTPSVQRADLVQVS